MTVAPARHPRAPRQPSKHARDPEATLKRRLTLAVALVLSAIAVTPTSSAANPVDDKRAEAKRIAAQSEQLTSQAERLNERAKQASDELASLQAQLGASRQQLDKQSAAVDGLRKRLAVFALNSYMRGDTAGGLGALLVDDGANEAGLRRGYAPAVLGDQTDLLDQLRAARQDIDSQTRAVQTKAARQQQLIATLAKDKADLEQTQQKLAKLAASVDQDLKAAVAEEAARAAAAAEAAAAERQRKELARRAAAAAERQRQALAEQSAAARRAAAAVSNSSPRSTGGGRAASPATPPAIAIPPTSAAAGIAVTEALRQRGKPYVFGTNGPDTFDCSGLTQWAWAKAGVQMAHFTVSQFQAFPRVPLDQLQPGDLVFFNVDLGHMGMYIGNGNIVQAPRTGDVVKVTPLAGRNAVGAVRPG